VKIRVQGNLIVPSNVVSMLANKYGRISEKVHTMKDLHDLLFPMKVDMFGNKMRFGGPNSPYLTQGSLLKMAAQS
jgi:hypothetical protein